MDRSETPRMKWSYRPIGWVPVVIAVIMVMPILSVPPGHALPSVSPLGSSPLREAQMSPSIFGVTALSRHGPGGEPSIAVNKYGTLLVGWMNWSGPASGTVPGINEVVESTDRGSNFTAPRPLPTTFQKYESDVSIVSGSSNGTFQIGYQSQPTSCSSTSSGVTVTDAWDNGSVLGDPALSMSCANGQYHDREWLGTTPNGTVFQVADVPVGLDAPDLLLTRSFDGVHFAPTQILTGDSYIAVGTTAYNNSLWAIGDTNYPAKQCEVLLSSNGGATWAATPASLPPECGLAVDPAAGIPGAEWQLAWGSSASLLVVYVDSGGIEFTRSNDLGRNWSSPQDISGNVPVGTSFQVPTIATDPATGAVAVSWLDTRSGNDAWRVYATMSADNGDSWSSVREISNGTVGTGPKFWPGDFIGSALTPWGTDGVVWGGNDSQGVLIPYFTQFALTNLSITSFAASPSPVPVGDTTNFTLTWRGATGAVSLAYAGLPPGCRTLNQSRLACAPTVTGNYLVRAFVNDTGGDSVSVTTLLTVTRAVLKSTYTVSFTESGLPVGTSWNVTFNGTAGSSATSNITFPNVVNNTTGYLFTVGKVVDYTSSPSIGSVLVNGANVTQAISFTRSSSPSKTNSTYAVTFTESGLKAGTSWSVALKGSASSSTTTTITFSEPNGTYAYTVRVPSGYTATPTSGSVTVSGKAVRVATVAFTKSSSTGFLGLSGDMGYILVGLIAAVAVAALAVLFLRGRGKPVPTSKVESKTDEKEDTFPEPKGHEEKSQAP
ncbi:MAG: hypothetical protein M1143_05020 [Candidatus Thermoplasmatota archaeon]|nr:hypothetical protein [Candidatus Thermoplasmatota archaeon]